jgi:transposase
LLLQVREDSYDGEAVVAFLRVLLRKIKGQALVIGDGSPIHHGPAIKEFLRAGASKRLQLEQLPGYAPDLNPDEGIWNSLKRVELGNVCCSELGDLRQHLLRAGVRLRHQPEVIRACSRQCGYLVSFLIPRSVAIHQPFISHSSAIHPGPCRIGADQTE